MNDAQPEIIDEFDLQFKRHTVFTCCFFHSFRLLVSSLFLSFCHIQCTIDKNENVNLKAMVCCCWWWWCYFFYFHLFFSVFYFLSHWIIYGRWQSPLNFKLLLHFECFGKRKICQWWKKWLLHTKLIIKPSKYCCGCKSEIENTK